MESHVGVTGLRVLSSPMNGLFELLVLPDMNAALKSKVCILVITYHCIIIAGLGLSCLSVCLFVCLFVCMFACLYCECVC